jgi:mannose-6-phosphate isomerase-like protein (cupin superfamily)
MNIVNLRKLGMLDAWIDADPTLRWQVMFPFASKPRSHDLSVVYIEIDPGKWLATHTDSAEEIVLVVEGTVEAEVADERAELGACEMVLIPPMTPHGFRNVGTVPARCLGFFGTERLVSTFEAPVMPLGISVIDTDEVQPSDSHKMSEVG